MRRTGASIAIAASMAMAFAAVGAAAPAQAAVPAKKRVTAVQEKNINQVLAGKAVLKVGDRGGAVRNVQKRLNNAGIITPITGRYTNSTSKAVSRFQGKFFWGSTGRVNAATYITLRKLTRHGSGVPAACRNASKIICIDKTQKIVRFYQNGNLKRSLDARFGAPGTPTREGNFRVNSKLPHNISTLYGTQMDWSLFFSGGQAVHFSKYFRAAGYNGASHGCVNLRDWKGAKWIYRHMPVGGKVKVYR
ncbi:MAG: L,D-transpeptidase family protein [Candidatus Nanopelagicales bacterium]|nr:murein L,D-transpeptidase [Candidatus Nanopelagicales bacterium]